MLQRWAGTAQKHRTRIIKKPRTSPPLSSLRIEDLRTIEIFSPSARAMLYSLRLLLVCLAASTSALVIAPAAQSAVAGAALTVQAAGP